MHYLLWATRACSLFPLLFWDRETLSNVHCKVYTTLMTSWVTSWVTFTKRTASANNSLTLKVRPYLRTVAHWTPKATSIKATYSGLWCM